MMWPHDEVEESLLRQLLRGVRLAPDRTGSDGQELGSRIFVPVDHLSSVIAAHIYLEPIRQHLRQALQRPALAAPAQTAAIISVAVFTHSHISTATLHIRC